MKQLIRIFKDKIMYRILYTPNGTLWTFHSKYKSKKDAEAVLRDFRNGYYRHVILLSVIDDGNVWYAINVVDNKQGYVGAVALT